MKCPNCSEEIDNNSKFCANCGNAVPINRNNKTNINNSNNGFFQDIVNTIIKKPKLILFAIFVLIFIIGISSMFNSTSTSDSNNVFGQEVTVYGLNFHIPEGYKETSRNEFTNGEYVDLKEDENDAWAIEISVSSDGSFKESKYVKSSFPYTINNVKGTVYSYKTGNMAFVYYVDDYLVVIKGADFDELKEIII